MTQNMTRPQIVDTELADLYYAAAKQSARVQSGLDFLHSVVKDRRRYVSRSRYVFSLSHAEAEAAVRALADDEAEMSWRRSEAQRALDTLDAARASLAEIREQMRPLDEEFAATRWTRFFLVPKGHIHSSMQCSTCRPTTEFGWLPTLSGLTEADAVAEHGALLCTICYPTAPVEWTNAITKKGA